jgi:MFS-type transporter involved in bile tolerance (Atg22 family)
MGGVGAIFSFLGGAALYEINPAFPFWMGSALVIVAGLLVILFIREPKVYETGEAQPGMLASLKEAFRDPDKSVLRLLFAIFFWFLAYTAIEAFFTLYAQKHLGLPEADGARLLGQLSLTFVLFALPAGYIGAKAGRRPTIMTGIALMTLVILAIYFTPAATLTQAVFTLPVLGLVPVIGLLLMVAGAAWALININSLPMVVDSTTLARVGTYTGLYYLFSTLAAIVGPNTNGWMVQLSNLNYNMVMLLAPVFLIVAFILMAGVRRGEATTAPAGDQA